MYNFSYRNEGNNVWELIYNKIIYIYNFLRSTEVSFTPLPREKRFAKIIPVTHFEIPAIHCRMKRYVSFGIEKRYHLVLGTVALLSPFEKHHHHPRRRILSSFVNRIVSIITSLFRIRTKISDLQIKNAG